ncbi:MAG TPA: hypothetical protein VLJ14_10340 [Ktedonobacterales bacterium]|jgi:hypothetical protein|nr:hypothetical protein [Ktedonobacterales bacterium]
MDDVEVEQTNRREEPPPGEKSAARWPRVVAQAAQVSQRMRLSRRTLTGLAAAVVAVLAIAGILLTKLGDPVGLARGLLNIPTPVPAATATPIPLNQTWFYIENGIPWGVLTVDGRTVTQLFSSSPPAVVLPRGRHTLAYDAAPFPPLRCVASVPADAHDTCPLDSSFVKAQARFPVDLQRRALDLRADVAHLPADQRAALEAAIQQQLAVDATPATVAPGERYRAPDGTIATAAQPLRATVVSQPAGDAGNSASLCSSFLCSEPFDPSQPTDAWLVNANVREGFRYMTLDGQVVADLAPFGEPRQASGDPREYSINLQVRWDGAWHVTEDPQAVGTHLDPCRLANELAPYGSGGVGPDVPVTFDRTFAAPHPADGCVVVQMPSPSNPNPPAGPIYYLYRFGVLLAATPAALDVVTSIQDTSILDASPDEQSLAFQIVAANQVVTVAPH